MPVATREINFNTKGRCDVIDITEMVANEIRSQDLENGIVCIFVPGSTGGVTTIEYEPGLVEDLNKTFDRLVPQNIKYAHDLKWKDFNGFSHVRAALLGASLTIPFSEKRLLLGTWQQIVFVDFDIRSRSRRLLLQILGE